MQKTCFFKFAPKRWSTGKNVFLEKKNIIFGNKTVDQRSGANLKKCVFAQICCKFLAFLKLFCSKNNKNNFLDQRLSEQHPNTGQNMQQICMCFSSFLFRRMLI